MDFYRVEHPTVMDGKVIRYRAVYGGAHFEVSVSRNGIVVGGSSPTMTVGDCQDVARVLERCRCLVPYLRRYDAEYGVLGTEGWDQEKTGFAFDPPCVIELRETHVGKPDTVVERRARNEDE